MKVVKFKIDPNFLHFSHSITRTYIYCCTISPFLMHSDFDIEGVILEIWQNQKETLLRRDARVSPKYVCHYEFEIEK